MTHLLDQLRPVARRAAHARPHLHALSGRSDRAECSTTADYLHTADVAAFLAFTELGGSAEHPERFAWKDNLDTLTRLTHAWLSREMQGAHTNYGDYRSRRAPRRGPALATAWAAWGHEPSKCSGAVLRPSIPNLLPQEQELTDQELAGLFPALRLVLAPYEIWVLEEHFLRGRSLRSIARDVAFGRVPVERRRKPRSTYDGDLGLKRAEKHVQKTCERALAKAATRLDRRWRVLAEDCA